MAKRVLDVSRKAAVGLSAEVAMWVAEQLPARVAYADGGVNAAVHAGSPGCALKLKKVGKARQRAV
jgi:hypothetical protein